MTAEVLIITKMAVALAADSAATISSRALGKAKTYNSANKLFALSKNYPVGIMVYGNSQIMNVPLEIIIKIYREKLNNKCFKNLNEYYNDFIAFLADFFTPYDQLEYVQKVTNEIFEFIREGIQREVIKKIEESEQGLLEEEVEQINLAVSDELVNHFYKEWEKQEILPLAEGVEEFQQIFNKHYNDCILKIQEKVFEQLNISEISKAKLIEIITFFFCKNIFDNPSGIVIAGLGEQDVFPSMFSFEAECVICNKLKYREGEIYEQQKVKNEGARVFAFAQSDMVNTFAFGIDPDLEEFANKFVEDSFNEYSKTIEQTVLDKIDLVDGLDEKIIENLKIALKETINNVNQRFNILDKYRKEMLHYQFSEHYVPITSMVQHLSKSELAEMAEALVNITSLKRRVSIELETVGGPVDVAVISKGDGFVWIKRKHYFDQKYNPHFIINRNNFNKNSELNSDHV